MNDVFDIKRFGKYFIYDLNNARGNFAVSALTIGLLPLILMVFNIIFGLLFSGEVPMIPIPVKVTIMLVAFLICVLSAPVKLYGSLTERRYGSDWLMLPASSFEKFLSMAIMLCIVLPVVVFGLFSICDLLLSWILPGTYGESVTKVIGNGFGDLDAYVDAAMSDSDSLLVVTPASVSLAGWLGWCTAVLPFGLGAICFKKGKSAKTILVIIGIDVILSTLMVLFLKGGYDNGYELGQRLHRFFGDMTAEKLEFWSNFIVNFITFVIVGGLLTGLFFRIKTLKH